MTMKLCEEEGIMKEKKTKQKTSLNEVTEKKIFIKREMQRDEEKNEFNQKDVKKKPKGRRMKMKKKKCE